MADVCDFLYTQGGLRFRSGSARVSVVIDGVSHDLKVIRNGKGRSRIERGEINLRDLAQYVPDGQSIDAVLTLDGVDVPLKLDPRTAMGREGRVKALDLDSETSGLSPDQKVALARSQIRSLPYSYANSDEAKVRLDWALSQGDLGVFDIEELRLVAGFLDASDIDRLLKEQPGLLGGLFEHTTSDNVDPELLALLPQEVEDRLCGDDFRVRVAGHPGMSPRVLEVLAKDPGIEIRRGVAGNASTPTAVLEALSKDEFSWVRAAVAGNTQTPASVFEVLAKDDTLAVRDETAENPQTPASALEVLAKNGNTLARRRIAENPQTPPSALEVLARDNDEDTRVAVARNSQTPPSALEVLSKDSEWIVRLRVAEHPQTPVSALEVLTKDSDWRVRAAVAEHPQTPVSALEVLAKDTSWTARTAVAKHPQTPPSALRLLSKDSEWPVRVAVAEHPQTPRRTLRKLAEEDPDLYNVRYRARERLARL